MQILISSPETPKRKDQKVPRRLAYVIGVARSEIWMLSSGVGVIHHLCSRVELHARLQGLPVRFIHTLTGFVLSSIASHPFDSYIVQSPNVVNKKSRLPNLQLHCGKLGRHQHSIVSCAQTTGHKCRIVQIRGSAHSSHNQRRILQTIRSTL